MKHNFKKLIAIFCASVTVFSFGACKTDGNENKNDYTPTETFLYQDGTHINQVSETNIPFIENGKTDYVLVVPETLSQHMMEAKEDFLLLFKRATGITLPVLMDTGLTHDADKKYLSLGNNSLFKTTGLSVDGKELGYDGYQVMTKDKSVYMVGAYEPGSVYSIYSFFEHMFNYKFYYSDYAKVDTNVKNLNLKNMQVKEIPDIPQRTLLYGLNELNENAPREGTPDCKYYAHRLRGINYDYNCPTYTEYNTSSKIKNYHNNADAVLPVTTYRPEHPEWYSESGTQLCYTAHGDAEEFMLMTQEAVKKIIFGYVSKEGLMDTFNILMQDDYKTCYCEACVEIIDYYGADSAPVCIWMNEVGRIFEEWQNGKSIYELFDERVIREDASWMATDPSKFEGRDNFKIKFMAYNNFAVAPVSYNEKTGKYEVKDDKVKLRDNIFVSVADIEMDYQKSILDEFNIEHRRKLEGWATISDNVGSYTYNCTTNEALSFYDVFNTVTAEEYSYRIKNKTVRFHLDWAGSGLKARQTAFKSLVIYLHFELSWNAGQDTQALIQEWFDGMYEEASEDMYGMFLDMRTYCNHIVKTYGLNNTNSIYNSVNKPEYWEKQVLVGWMKRCEDAYKKIEKYKDIDPEYYDILYGRIATEYVSPAYLFLKYYGKEISSTERNAFIDRLLDEGERYELLTMTNSGWRSEYYGDAIIGMR